jgi:hypothetical protein
LTPPPTETALDQALTAQIAVAWAGERGEEQRRLGWWRTDLVSEFGGEDLLRRLMPRTWRWATLRAVREAAPWTDEALRSPDAEGDRAVSLFRFGFKGVQRVSERKTGSCDDALASLLGRSDVVQPSADYEPFSKWNSSFCSSCVCPPSVGKRLVESPRRPSRTPNAHLRESRYGPRRIPDPSRSEAEESRHA